MDFRLWSAKKTEWMELAWRVRREDDKNRNKNEIVRFSCRRRRRRSSKSAKSATIKYKLIRALQLLKNHTIVWLLPTIGNHQSWRAQLLSRLRANERTHIANTNTLTRLSNDIYCRRTEIARSLTFISIYTSCGYGVRVLSFHAAHNHIRAIQSVRSGWCTLFKFEFLNITKLFLIHHDRNRIEGGVCGAGMRAPHRMWNEQTNNEGKKLKTTHCLRLPTIRVNTYIILLLCGVHCIALSIIFIFISSRSRSTFINRTPNIPDSEFK